MYSPQGLNTVERESEPEGGYTAIEHNVIGAGVVSPCRLRELPVADCESFTVLPAEIPT